MIDKANIRRNLSRLMAAKSISGTADEIQGAEVILDMLHELDYFKAHSENIFTVPVEGDQLGRYIVAALMCGSAAGDTIILTGHYDVVDTDEFAQLKDIAFDMDAITARIGAAHERRVQAGLRKRGLAFRPRQRGYEIRPCAYN